MSPRVLLIHGAWHRGSCFAALQRCLTDAGAQVSAPDLRGHDGTPYGDVASLDDYAAPALEALRAFSEPAIVVGHSLGGVTVSHLAEQAPEQIAHLVYLTAALVPGGGSAGDILFGPAYTQHPDAQGLFQIVAPTADEHGIGIDLERPDLIGETFYGDCDAATREAALAGLVPVTPMPPFQAASTITPERFGMIPRTYVECSADHVIPLSIQQDMYHQVPGGDVVTLASSHSAFLSRPAEVAQIVLGTARS